MPTDKTKPPEILFLQWHGNAEPDDLGDVSLEDVTWSDEQVFEHDVAYLRVPSGMMEKKALAGLWPGYDRVEWAKMRTTVVYACRDFPDAVAVLLKTAIERRARKDAP